MKKDSSNIPSSLGDMPADEFRQYGHQLIDWIADHFQNIDNVPVLPDIKPNKIRKTISSDTPE